MTEILFELLFKVTNETAKLLKNRFHSLNKAIMDYSKTQGMLALSFPYYQYYVIYLYADTEFDIEGYATHIIDILRQVIGMNFPYELKIKRKQQITTFA